MQSILGGVGGMLVLGWMMLSLFVLNPPGNLTSADVKVFSGTVKSASEISSKDTSLDVWLEGQEFPFRCFGGAYPQSFDPSTLALLRPGATARVSVKLDDADKLRHNRAQNQSFRPMVALEVNDKPALTLEAYNAWSVANQQTARLFLPVMFCASIYLCYSGVQARRFEKSFGMPQPR